MSFFSLRERLRCAVVPNCPRVCWVRARVSLCLLCRCRALHLSEPPPCVLHQRRSERRKLWRLPDIWLWREHVLASDVCTLCSWTMRKDVKRRMNSCFVHICVSWEADANTHTHTCFYTWVGSKLKKSKQGTKCIRRTPLPLSSTSSRKTLPWSVLALNTRFD